MSRIVHTGVPTPFDPASVIHWSLEGAADMAVLPRLPTPPPEPGKVYFCHKVGLVQVIRIEHDSGSVIGRNVDKYGRLFDLTLSVSGKETRYPDWSSMPAAEYPSNSTSEVSVQVRELIKNTAAYFLEAKLRSVPLAFALGVLLPRIKKFPDSPSVQIMKQSPIAGSLTSDQSAAKAFKVEDQRREFIKGLIEVYSATGEDLIRSGALKGFAIRREDPEQKSCKFSSWWKLDIVSRHGRWLHDFFLSQGLYGLSGSYFFGAPPVPLTEYRRIQKKFNIALCDYHLKKDARHTEGSFSSLINAAKSDISLIGPIAEMTRGRIDRTRHLVGPVDLVIPMPSRTPAANRAVALANVVSLAWDCQSVVDAASLRSHRPRTDSSLPPLFRRALASGGLHDADEAIVRAKDVIAVDDNGTSWMTADDLRRALYDSGARTVKVVAFGGSVSRSSRRSFFCPEELAAYDLEQARGTFQYSVSDSLLYLLRTAQSTELRTQAAKSLIKLGLHIPLVVSLVFEKKEVNGIPPINVDTRTLFSVERCWTTDRTGGIKIPSSVLPHHERAVDSNDLSFFRLGLVSLHNVDGASSLLPKLKHIAQVRSSTAFGSWATLAIARIDPSVADAMKLCLGGLTPYLADATPRYSRTLFVRHAEAALSILQRTEDREEFLTLQQQALQTFNRLADKPVLQRRPWFDHFSSVLESIRTCEGATFNRAE